MKKYLVLAGITLLLIITPLACAANSALGNRVSALESKLEVTNARMSELEDEVAMLEIEVSSLESRLEGTNNRITQWMETLAPLVNEYYGIE